MLTNTGGFIDPTQAVGRAQEVADLWATLDVQSVYMHAERRIGKTTILALLDANPRDGWRVIKRDLEGLHSAEEFAQRVYADVDEFLGKSQKAARRVRDWLKLLGGVDVGGIIKLPEGKDFPWKTMLEKSVADLCQAIDEGAPRLLFLWDEVPFMLQNIAKRQGKDTAMEVLDVLRSLRQTFPKLRMVLTGSIGLHHVVSDLKAHGYGNAPINDMESFRVDPLKPEHGQELAMHLLQGERIPCSDLPVSGAAIANAVEHFPFYIHHLVRALKRKRCGAEVETISSVLGESLTSADDPWQLRHYRERIATYYAGNELLVLAILDDVASAEPRSFREIRNAVQALSSPGDDEKLRHQLMLLERDHYLRRKADGSYTFTYALIRRWWRLDRGLGMQGVV